MELKSWYQIALDAGAKEIDGGINGSEFARLGIAIINGCPGCQATVAPYNSFQVAPGNPYAYCQSCATQMVEA